MSAPSMVSRSGDSLVIRSVVSGNRLYVDDEDVEESSTTQLKTSSITDHDAKKEDVQIERTTVSHPTASMKIIEQIPPPTTGDEDLPQCKVKRNYACNLCSYFTQNPRQHLHHLRDIHKEKVKIYECKDCLYASRHFQKLARHMRIVHDKDESISNQQNHNSDLRKTTTLRRARKRTKRPMDEMYEEDYADSTIFDDYIINETQTPASTINKQQMSEELNVNEMAAVTVNNNNNNKLENNNNNKLKCSLCPFTTRHQGHLTRHERQDHIKTRFFRCVKCSYVTHIKARFTKHVKYHSMPMIKCDLCDFRTPYKWNLDRHNKNHNGHGAFKCCACNFTADIKQSLTVHEINHHIPPVGQAAAAGLGVGRRRNKVGASDSNLPTTSASSATINNHEQHNDLYTQISNSRPIIKQQELSHTIQQQFNNVNNNINNNNNNNKSTNSSPIIAKKKCRPIPNLIPIQNTGTLKLLSSPKYTLSSSNNESAILSPINISQQDLNDLCAKSINSSLRDFTSLFDDHDQDNITNRYNDIVEITAIKNEQSKTLSPQTIALQKKNASFFDKLKEKLMTNALPGADSLTCRGCGHTVKCLSEMATHQKQCGKCTDDSTQEQSVPHFSSTRCQYCRQRCKSSTDLIIHMQSCNKIHVATNDEDNSNDNKEPHPMENKVFVWNSMPEKKENQPMEVQANEESTHTITDDSNETANGLDLSVTNVSENSTIDEISIHAVSAPIPSKPITHGTDLDLATNGKRVFKCPHCSFWATTASRFHVHIVGHLNKKPFECSLCSYRSNWRWDITKHIRLKSVRDSAHQQAKVLMTDETGRRNYSKYNKYLMQMKESSLSPTTSDNKMIDNKKSRGATTGNVIVTTSTQGNDEESIFTKLPPGIKVTRSVKNCDSELNNNQASISIQNNISNNNATSELQKTMKQELLSPTLSVNSTVSASSGGPRRSLWKCKKCNFRDVDRQVLLQHVKEHYIQQRFENVLSSDSTTNQTSTPANQHQQQGTESSELSTSSEIGTAQTFGENNSNDDERHCRLKHRGNISVLTEDTAEITNNVQNISSSNTAKTDSESQCVLCPFKSNSSSIFLTHMEKHSSQSDIAVYRCIMCTFNATDHKEFISHLSLHNIETTGIESKLFGNLPSSKENTENSKRFKCTFCPYVSNSKNQFYYHEQFHKPRGAQFKCNLCSYNVTRRHLLHQHLKIHGISSVKRETRNTRIETEIPLVWIQFENEFIKMYKCPQCPQTNIDKVVIEKHEKGHENLRSETLEINCKDCTFGTNTQEILDAHNKYHQGVFGTIHCLVNKEKSDEEQISQLSKVLRPLEENIEVQTNNNNDKEIHFCDNCPARFLSETEYLDHLKSHRTKLTHRCPCCNYSTNQENILNGHLKVHTEDYQEQSKLLQTIFPTNQVNKCPRTAILMDVPEIKGPAWIVVSMNSPPKLKENDIISETTIIPKKYYRCKLCPDKFCKYPALKFHKKLHGSDNPFKCSQCNYATTTKAGLLKHDYNHNHIDSDPEIDEINLPNGDLEIKQPQIQSPPTTSPLYVDDQFGILMHGSPEFIYPTYVKNGKVKEKRYKCHKCPSAFEKREQYRNHLTLHGSKQKYCCKQCDYSVKYYANYVQHLRKHKLNEDAQAVKLKNHTENQNGTIENETIVSIPEIYVPPLKISVADRQALMLLQQRRTSDQPKDSNENERKQYPCPNCPYSNSRRDSIDNHIKRHISIGGITSNFTCKYCDFSVPQSHFLRDHVKVHFLPLKIYKPEAYMCYEQIQIWSKNDENDETLIFADESDLKNNVYKFNPPIEIDSDDTMEIDSQESVIVNISNGEVIFKNDTPNDTKDN
ncbi:uncharacterized protein LOC123290885 isoform X2 [Chrysoperla carnea]|uniref:uncharacterized protein LOC123290885 isoform X2 n=1 Tax=Chrysoperla carnea TaxID=189513 RepID=UPI001D086663|nr:uncharacterized protein LOC123290885 isoform X2 [Chrysoperla carnea]